MLTRTLSPEAALLLSACVPSEPLAPPSPLSEDPLDWDRLAHQARWHRMEALLWRHLRGSARGLPIPQHVEERFRAARRDTTAKALAREPHLREVLGAFATAGIDTMLLKGAALVEAVYPDPDLRPMDDVDILVPPTAIREAQSILESLGYRGLPKDSERDEDRLASHFHHYPLVNAAGTMVELHQHVSWASPEFDVDDLWERGVPSAVGPHRLPAPADLMFHVAIHFSEDRITRRPCALGQLADLAWIADRWPIDWEDLVRRGISYGEADRLFLALFAARRLLRDVVPESAVDALRPDSFRRTVGERFISRVLWDRPSVPVEELARRNRPLFTGRAGLDWFVHPDEPRPSTFRLRLRRAGHRVRSLARAVASPARLWGDLALSRWILGLRGGKRKAGG